MRGRRLVLMVVVGGLALNASSSIAQGQRRRSTPPPESPRRTFADRIDVRVVNLEAVVVDKAGDRVFGLAPGDFVLEIDGKPTPIGYFSEVEDGVAVETELPVLDGSALVAPAGVSPGEPVGTSFLVFIDSYFTTHAARRNRILDEIEPAPAARCQRSDRSRCVWRTEARGSERLVAVAAGTGGGF